MKLVNKNIINRVILSIFDAALGYHITKEFELFLAFRYFLVQMSQKGGHKIDQEILLFKNIGIDVLE